jgi:3-oxoacyl-[acyl-carrier protein] reductase
VSAVLVTGGSRGIGRTIVEALVGEFTAESPAGSGAAHQVAFTWNTSEAEARAVEAAAGGRARAFQLDLRDRGRPDDLIAEVEAALGPVAGLVNNAGLRRESLLALTSDEDWDAVLDANLGGLFRCCRAALRGMLVRRRGAIVNVSSLSALHGVAGQAAYAASKAGILGLTRSLAREVGKRGVRVNAVVPGFVATDLTAGLPPAAIEVLRAGECLPGGTSAGNVAEAVLFLLSERAAGITGQTLVVDAGASA